MRPYKPQFKENNGEMTQEEVKASTLNALQNLIKNSNQWAARELAIKLSEFGFWQKGQMAALGGEEGIQIAKEIFSAAIDEIHSFPNPSLVNDIYDVVYHWDRPLQERATRAEYGDFQKELQKVKELYEEFKSKVDEALSFDPEDLYMSGLDDKRNQLDFLVETFEVINGQI